MFCVDLVPAFEDNYLFLLSDPAGTKKAAVVDPGDAFP
jgi:hypothetical protein